MKVQITVTGYYYCSNFKEQILKFPAITIMTIYCFENYFLDQDDPFTDWYKTNGPNLKDHSFDKALYQFCLIYWAQYQILYYFANDENFYQYYEHDFIALEYSFSLELYTIAATNLANSIEVVEAVINSINGIQYL